MNLSTTKRLKLPPSCRLSKQRDFEDVFQKGRRLVGKFMIMWVLYSSRNVSRVGAIASKRTFRRSVERSRARRVLREVFRLNLPEIKPCVDIVLLARRAILDKKYQEIERDFSSLAHIAGFIKSENYDSSADV